MTHSTEAMMKTSPSAKQMSGQLSSLAACVAACFDCVQTCTVCANACLGEPQVDMLKQCILLNEDCADVCLATGRVMSRLEKGLSAAGMHALLQACAAACAECAAECDKHASTQMHCKL